MTGRFDLLELEVLRGAGADRDTEDAGPQRTGGGQGGPGRGRILQLIPVQFLHHAFIEVTELARDLGQPETLLPPVQPVGRGIADVEHIAAGLAQLALEAFEQGRDVIDQLGAGQRGTRGQAAVGFDRDTPGAQDRFPAPRQSVSEVGKCGRGRRRGGHSAGGWAVGSMRRPLFVRTFDPGRRWSQDALSPVSPPGCSPAYSPLCSIVPGLAE